MASDPRVNTPCGLEGPGQKVKMKNNFKTIFSSIPLSKQFWTDSWHLITQFVCFEFWVIRLMKLRSA